MKLVLACTWAILLAGCAVQGGLVDDGVDDPCNDPRPRLPGPVANDLANASRPSASAGILSFREVTLDACQRGITMMRFVPGTHDVVVADLGGLSVYHLDDQNATLAKRFRVADVYEDGSCGLISMAFDPAFATNRFLYLGYCPDAHRDRVSRYVFDWERLPNGSTLEGAEVITVGVPGVGQPFHAAGSLGFEPDGTMWGLFGDREYPSHAQNRTVHRGSLLRFVPNREGSGFSTPTDAAERAAPGEPDVFANGMRSPWTGLLDSHGRYWIGDVGASWEEINVLAQPANLGWPLIDGRCASVTNGNPCSHLHDPLFDWPHTFNYSRYLDDPLRNPYEAWVAWVGIEYLPRDEDPYAGRLSRLVLYGEMCQGWIRGVELAPEGHVVQDRHLGHLPGITSWDVAPDGRLYASTFSDCNYSTLFAYTGKLWRVELAADAASSG